MTATKLTVLILTYNRYPRLIRLLKYIDSLKITFDIYVLDSSSEPHDFSEIEFYLKRNLIRYFRFEPSTNVIEKICKGLKVVTAPYTVIWADDDFMIPGTFEIGMQFLDQNKDYCFVHGQGAIFQKVDGFFPLNSFSYYHQRNIVETSAVKRFINHLNNYTCIFYSLYRTELLRRSMELCWEYQFSFNFDEIVPGCIAVIHGKGKKFDKLYFIRERHENIAALRHEQLTGESDYFDWVTSPVFAKDSTRMIQVLADEISKIDRISVEESKEIVTQAFWKYLANGLNKKWKDKYGSQTKWRTQLRKIKALHSLWMGLRSLSRREQDRFLLPALKRKSSPYHRDFQSVYRWMKTDAI